MHLGSSEHVSSAMMVHLPKHMDKSNDAFSITIKSKGGKNGRI